ncbi:integrase catalytic domain-containing protein [Trichonephila clavata]|uniref:Integrase catalytic domain-containing protein n=1 Tax=Trichonephila clavata TaxID=2740835 RepID=A0A8X6FXH6_TRICU|nr:integrase catalytic domain-containing protein [Trichonephila clavata]
MSTEQFLLAFRRFISRRGLCSTIYSDNAKTFKRAELELKHFWRCMLHPSVQDLFSTHGITWKYIVEKGAWWGGFWERHFRTIKTCLRKIIGRSSLSLNELETVFIEIEAMINSRPITYIYDDPSEPSPLTPAHFLIVTCQFKVDDVVLIHDDRFPRNLWSMGKIIETYTGRDGKIRSCLVKTKNNAIRRPVQLLYNLEV